MAWQFHAIGATFSSRPCRLDGVGAHEGPHNISQDNLTHWLISTQASIERQIEAAIKSGTDTTALEATYLARVEIARDEHRAAAVDLRRRGELHAAMDAFREAKHLDFVYQHRKALVEAGGLGDAPPPPEVIARRRLEAAHARLDAISEPLS
jgi:hypothetical protein